MWNVDIMLDLCLLWTRLVPSDPELPLATAGHFVRLLGELLEGDHSEPTTLSSSGQSPFGCAQALAFRSV